MNRLTAIAIDDNESALKIIEVECDKIKLVQLIKTFSGPIEAGNYLKTNTNIDLIFLDINMPEMSGLEFLETYKPKQSIIFISKHKEKAFDVFEIKSKFKIEVLDFLEMPFRTARFVEACNLAMEKLKNNINFTIQKSKNISYKIIYDSIILIESDQDDGHLCYFYLTDKIADDEKNPLQIRRSLTDLEKELPEEIFHRVSKNAIININKVKLLKGDEITTSFPKKKISIGDKWKDKVKTLIQTKIIK